MSNLWAPGRVPVEAISTRMALRQLLLGRLGMFVQLDPCKRSSVF